MERVDESGLFIRLVDGSEFSLPPDLEAIENAPEGLDRLRSTGAEVENPDLPASWTVTRPDA